MASVVDVVWGQKRDLLRYVGGAGVAQNSMTQTTL